MILGIRVDNLSWDEARTKAREFLNSTEAGNQYKIFTPNPEMLVKARKDNYFREVLNKGDLNLCDGFGLRLFAKARRIPGIDFMLELCRIAAEQGLPATLERSDGGRGRSVYLLGSGDDEVVRKTAENLRKQFPQLKIAGYDKGPEIHENIKTREHKNKLANQQYNNITMKQWGNETNLEIDTTENNGLIDKINASNAEIIFVAFGMGKQEKWIHENLPKLPGVKIAMGVGGAFDYLSGKTKRAPCWMRKIGLEWIYRLSQEPHRLRRILNATAVFIWLVLKESLKHENTRT